MKMMEAVKTCFRKYAVFKGRARRSEYWKFVLFNLIVSAVFMTLSMLLADRSGGGNSFNFAYALMTVYSIAVILPSLAVMARRLHDGGRSAGFLFLILVPIGQIFVLVWLIQDGDPGDNQYGPNPKSERKPTPPERKLTPPEPLDPATPPVVPDTPVSPEEKYWVCPKCGEKVKETASFCTHCGTSRSGPKSTVVIHGFTPPDSSAVSPGKPAAKPDPNIWETPSDF